MKYLNLSEKLNTEEKALLFEKAISILKELELDNDTSEILLHEIGTSDIVFDFLIGQERYLTAQKVWDDIFQNETLIYNNFNDYFNEEFMKDL